MSIQIEPVTTATRASLPEIESLLVRTLPRPRPWRADLEWLYVSNPLGPTWFVNARSEGGELVAHHGAMPIPPPDDPRFRGLATFFILHAIVDPGVQVPGLMIATARLLYRHLELLGPSLLLGVANEKTVTAYTRLLGFHSLGRLALRFHAPGSLPAPDPPRALALDENHLRWRAGRPDTDTFVVPSRGAVIRRIQYKGLPVDVVLTVGLPEEAVSRLELPRRAQGFWPAAVRLHASFGNPRPGGTAVPERLRPSPLEYVFRANAPSVDQEALAEHLSSRRFEFFDFDVI